MHPELKHRNHERVTAVSSLCVLGEVVRPVQTVPITAPINIIALCRILTFALCALDFLRNQTTNFFLTSSQHFHLLSTTDRPRLRTSAATAWANWMLPRLLRSGCAALRNCGEKVAGRANGGDTTPGKGLSGLAFAALRARITGFILFENERF